MLRLFYSLIFTLGIPVILLRLIWRGLRAPAYFKRWGERFALKPPTSDKSLIWIHAVSMGEVEAARPLIASLLSDYPSHQLLITTMTPTGSDRVRTRYGSTVLHCYLPYDIPFVIRRFLRIVQPKLGIIMETELWPNLIHYSAEQAIPLVLANARLSARSAKGYQRIPKTTQALLSAFSLIAAQTEADRSRLIALGANKSNTHTTGNLKFETSLPPHVEEDAAALKRAWGDRPILIAASTHEGEEQMVLNAARQIRAALPDLLLILVPRHPERFDKVAALSQRAGYRTLRRSEDTLCTLKTQVFVVDTMGELPLFYATADIAFVGGSLVPKGGQNLLEPALLGKPVLIGPHYFNFQHITTTFFDAEAALQVDDSASLAETATRLLQLPEQCKKMGEAGQHIIQQSQGASVRLMNLIKRHIHV